MSSILETLAMLAPLPWTTDLVVGPGVIFAGRGLAIVVVDLNHEMPDRDAHSIARCIIHAMNEAVVLAEVVKLSPSIVAEQRAIYEERCRIAMMQAQALRPVSVAGGGQ